MSSVRATGLQIFSEVHGQEKAKGLDAYMQSADFGVDLARWATDFAFGTVWAREGLERKLRSCAVLGMMIALRQSDEIKQHTKVSIANGLSRIEIEEILLSTVPYAGLPAANLAKAAMSEAFRELEAEGRL